VGGDVLGGIFPGVAWYDTPLALWTARLTTGSFLTGGPKDDNIILAVVFHRWHGGLPSTVVQLVSNAPIDLDSGVYEYKHSIHHAVVQIKNENENAGPPNLE
jgi:hypothetical protein